jgi:hypothetical protein
VAHIENSTPIDSGNGLFDILGLVQIRLNGSWWWQGEDLDEEGCRGSVFRTWGEGEPDGLDKAFVLVADVTDDPTEPDISQITIGDIERVDDELHTDIARGLEESGCKLIKWSPSQLNESPQFKALVTLYITEDQGKERQYFVLRASANNRKLIVMGCFDVAEHETFASPILETLREAIILG